MSTTDHELLRLDYEQTVSLLGLLNEVRFKLLALVPTVAGAGVALLSRNASRDELVAIGLIGLVATAGVLLYEQRNSEHHRGASSRARELERLLGFPELAGSTGAYGTAPPSTWWGQRTGLGLVYGAALGAWAYVVAWGLFAFAGTGEAQALGGVVGAIVAAAVFAWESRPA